MQNPDEITYGAIEWQLILNRKGGGDGGPIDASSPPPTIEANRQSATKQKILRTAGEIIQTRVKNRRASAKADEDAAAAAAATATQRLSVEPPPPSDINRAQTKKPYSPSAAKKNNNNSCFLAACSTCFSSLRTRASAFFCAHLCRFYACPGKRDNDDLNVRPTTGMTSI